MLCVASRYYRRLLQMGVTNAELWTNMGLCCFYASQYDMCLGCFQRALQLADDSTLPDIWYNLGQVRDQSANTAHAPSAPEVMQLSCTSSCFCMHADCSLGGGSCQGQVVKHTCICCAHLVYSCTSLTGGGDSCQGKVRGVLQSPADGLADRHKLSL